METCTGTIGHQKNCGYNGRGLNANVFPCLGVLTTDKHNPDLRSESFLSEGSATRHVKTRECMPRHTKRKNQSIHQTSKSLLLD